MFAPAYMGRRRRGEAPSEVCLFLSPSPLYETVTLSFVIATGASRGPAAHPRDERRLGPATALYRTATLPFVIPSEAEGSAVPRTSRGNAEHYPQTELSSRPERSAVERSAVSIWGSRTRTFRPVQIRFEKRLGSATTVYGTVALSFVIPSVPGFPTSQPPPASLMWFSPKRTTRS